MKNKLRYFAHRKQEWWKFIKFNVTILVTSALDLAVYSFLFYVVFRSLHHTPVKNIPLLAFMNIRYRGYLYAYGISTTVGYIAAYVMNRKITFHSDVHPLQSSVAYIIMVTATILFSTWLGGAVGTFLQEHHLSTPVTELAAKFIVINIPTVWTYPLERFVIQRKKKNKENVYEYSASGH